MSLKSRRRPSASLVISLVALVIAASGTAVAASRLVSGDKLIKKGSLSGNRLRNHTLTGKQLKLAKLGKVPSAKTADSARTATQATSALTATSATHATSADTATSAGNGAKRIDFMTTSGTDPAPAPGETAPGAHTLLTLDELTVTASCVNAGGSNVRVYVAFGAATGNLDWAGTAFNNLGNANPNNIQPVTDGVSFTPNGVHAFAVADTTGGNTDVTLEVIYRNDSRTITADLHAGAGALTTGCDVEGTAVAAPG